MTSAHSDGRKIKQYDGLRNVSDFCSYELYPAWLLSVQSDCSRVLFSLFKASFTPVAGRGAVKTSCIFTSLQLLWQPWQRTCGGINALQKWSPPSRSAAARQKRPIYVNGQVTQQPHKRMQCTRLRHSSLLFLGYKRSSREAKQILLIAFRVPPEKWAFDRPLFGELPLL